MQNNIPFDQRDYFKKPFSRQEIEKLLKGRPAMEIFNPRSPAVKKLDRDIDSYSDDELIDLMVSEPRFVRRPVVKIDGKTYFSADAKKLRELIV